MVSQIGLIAAGTGITPMIQIINSVINNPHDNTKISLLYANITLDDILLHDYLDKVSSAHPNKLKIVYTLDNPPDNWSGQKGRISASMIKSSMPTPDLDTSKLIIVCGPPKMMDLVSGNKISSKDQGQLQGYLKHLGYSKHSVYKF
ncbi:hypothetical protein BB561_005887 [Smittium simulii]|uniref:Oxidoreductase FAD/NAD(P)-binding domain-containing protein n=1 Tax=Smittium simulii TaxID=133385 RepID=A0A2T9Y7S9_9FUNG|nr:hypothetical protein BB561_005887 [Smittium simulii]